MRCSTSFTRARSVPVCFRSAACACARTGRITIASRTKAPENGFVHVTALIGHGRHARRAAARRRSNCSRCSRSTSNRCTQEPARDLAEHPGVPSGAEFQEEQSARVREEARRARRGEAMSSPAVRRSTATSRRPSSFSRDLRASGVQHFIDGAPRPVDRPGKTFETRDADRRPRARERRRGRRARRRGGRRRPRSARSPRGATCRASSAAMLLHEHRRRDRGARGRDRAARVARHRSADPLHGGRPRSAAPRTSGSSRTRRPRPTAACRCRRAST